MNTFRPRKARALEVRSAGSKLGADGSTLDSAWAQYVRDVYGQVPEGLTLDDVRQWNWVYWSAPLDQPVKVWWFPESSYQVDVVNFGDGAMHMYHELGFWRHTAREPNPVVNDGTRTWAEVIRRASPHENHASTGVWYYAARGSGFWLDLGRLVDFTCSTIGDSVGATAASTTTIGYNRSSLPINCVAERSGLRRCRSRLCARASCGASSDSEPCRDGAEHVSPPIQANVIPTGGLARVLRPHGFDSALRWPPRLFYWWMRSNLKEVVDLRLYPSCLAWCESDGRGWSTKCSYSGCSDCPACSGTTGVQRYARETELSLGPRVSARKHPSPCGGKSSNRSSSSSIRTGWHATGAPCIHCIHTERHLNCGPRVPPFVAHAKSLNAFWNGSGLAAVRGRCTRARAAAVNFSLSGPSVSKFVQAAEARACERAFLWWPPRLPGSK